jgi:hemerythrin-like metal-binding protein
MSERVTTDRVPLQPVAADDPRSDDEPFDAHHQLQAAMIDAYEAALETGAARQLAADTLGHLVDFTAVHFVEEERFMTQRAYPRLEVHRAAHQRLLAQLRSLEAEARTVEAAVALSSVPALRTWLADHVSGMDRDLSEWSAAQDQRRQPSQTR